MKKWCLILFSIVAIFSGCKRDKDIDCPEGYIQVGDECVPGQKVITTLILEFTEDSSGIHTSFSFQDIDGPGGDSPVVDTVILEEQKTYHLSIDLWDDSRSPAVHITPLIIQEVHQFFFSVSDNNHISIEYNDEDENGLPVGFENICTTGINGNGSLNILLMHQTGGKDGNVTTGLTDINVDFDFIIN